MSRDHMRVTTAGAGGGGAPRGGGGGGGGGGAASDCGGDGGGGYAGGEAADADKHADGQWRPRKSGGAELPMKTPTDLGVVVVVQQAKNLPKVCSSADTKNAVKPNVYVKCATAHT